jgi:gas vesicle protein
MAKKHRHGSVADFFVVSAIAGSIGYLAGLLTSPKSGKQNRKKVKQVAKKSRKAAEAELDSLGKELGDIISNSKKATESMTKKAQGEYGLLVDKAKNAKEAAQEVLSAIKEGKAKDKDLDMAVKDAKAVIIHAQDFVKKKQ